MKYGILAVAILAVVILALQIQYSSAADGFTVKPFSNFDEAEIEVRFPNGNISSDGKLTVYIHSDVYNIKDSGFTLYREGYPDSTVSSAKAKISADSINPGYVIYSIYNINENIVFVFSELYAENVDNGKTPEINFDTTPEIPESPTSPEDNTEETVPESSFKSPIGLFAAVTLVISLLSVITVSKDYKFFRNRV